MARGHKAVVRRSLSPAEWMRIRLGEVSVWRERASQSTGPWEAREAIYEGPGAYRFTSPWRRIADGQPWGSPDGTCFFRSRLRASQALAGLPVEMVLATPAEVLVRLGGRLVAGIDPNRSRVALARRARAGQTWPVELEAYVRSAPDDMRVVGEVNWGCVQTWRSPRLVSYDRLVEAFLYDMQVAMDAACCEAVDADVRDLLMHHLDAALKLVDRDTSDRRRLHASLADARRYLREHIYEAEDLAGPGRLALVAHAHVDIAYHWRIRQGLRKNLRTTVVQLALMEEYPELLYCHTQPYVYEQLKEHYPEVYTRLKRKVRSGQWELVGGTYVECDGNVPSPESLIRQCLLGKRFFLREFGVDVDTCWLPDVFGNSWAMPQILAKSGIRYFVSNKMSTWNDTNRFPHTNFLWRGVDGTEVAACVPATHFISWLSAEQLLGNWEGFAEKVEVGESMNMYGFGDGGGGATREMLEAARRLRAFPGLPRTRLATARQYLDEAFADRSRLAVWDDELYLEMHRGVTTTKAALKRLNRRCELAAREAEVFSCLAGRARRGPAVRRRLTAAWKRVLVGQFHDILPGSHTQPVGLEAAESYRGALGEFEAVRAEALRAICRQVRTHEQDGTPQVVFNSMGWARGGVVEVAPGPGGAFEVVTGDGRRLPCQLLPPRDGENRLLVSLADVPSVGHEVIYVRPADAAPASGLHAAPDALENAFFRVALDEKGQVTRLLDKRCNREVIPRGQVGNVLELFEDKPGTYDAWDIVATFEDKRWPIDPPEAVRVVERGCVRAGVEVERRFFDSRLVQRIWIYRDLERIDFETFVDWHEHNRLLKVGFPVAVLARAATFDLGYGSIRRPTHRNTSWDEAKFEVCGHKWADLSEAGYGLSVLNDGKYGWDVTGNRIRLSLLRGPIRPDPNSDIGEHAFTYSLYPHAGTWQDAGTFRAAYELNSPLLAVAAERHGGRVAGRRAMVSVAGEGVHLGAMKPAEDGRGVVVRLVEQHGGRGPAAIELDRPLAAAHECDLLERPLRKVRCRRRGLACDLLPFEIKSFLVELG